MQTNSSHSQQGVRAGFEGAENHRGSRTFRRARFAAGGFSLIEVVIALGVVSFAFVALFGMLPVGLNAFNNSIDSTMESQIAQSVMSQLRQAKFSQLYTVYNDAAASASGAPSFFKPYTQQYAPPATGFYYDDQGNFLGFVEQNSGASTTGMLTSIPQSWIYAAGAQIYYDSWDTTTNSTPPFGTQPEGSTVASTTISTTKPQPFATVILTIHKLSAPNTARIYTGYILNNGL